MRPVSNADPDRYEVSVWSVARDVLGGAICLVALYLAWGAVWVAWVWITRSYSLSWIILGSVYLMAVLVVPAAMYVHFRRRAMLPGRAIVIAAAISLAFQIPFLPFVFVTAIFLG